MIVGLFDAAGLFEDLGVSEGNVGTNQQLSSPLLPPGLQRAWHRNTGSCGSVCPQQERDTSVSYLTEWGRWRVGETWRRAFLLSYLLSGIKTEVCPFSLSSSSDSCLDKDELQGDESWSNPPKSGLSAKLDHNHTDANTDRFYQFTQCGC